MNEDIEFLAYCDGLYDEDPRRKSAIESRLRSDPEALVRAHTYEAQNKALREAYGGWLHEPVPERFSALLNGLPPKPRAKWLRAAALCLLFGVGASSGWLVGHNSESDSWQAENFVNRSLLHYSTASSEKRLSNEPVNVAPVGWSSQERAFPLNVPDLHVRGYSVVKKETIGEGDEKMLKLVYAAPDGRNFNLFLQPHSSDHNRILIEKRHGVSVAYWSGGSVAGAVVSTWPSDELHAIASQVRRALRNPQGLQPDNAPAPVITSAGSETLGNSIQPFGKTLSEESDAPPQPLGRSNRWPG